MFPSSSYSGGWTQPYPYYNTASSGGAYPYSRPYEYRPPTATNIISRPVPPGAPFQGYQSTRPSFYYPEISSYPPQQQPSAMPALTFDGMSSEDLYKAQQSDKQRRSLFYAKLFLFVKFLNRSNSVC